VKTLLGESVDVQVSSTGIRVDNATVVEPYDVMASNGIIHAIDSVLVPANMDLPSFANATTDLEMAEPTESIYELASGTGDFSTLAAAIDAAGLANALSGNGSLTVFAPTNEAFSNLPAELLDYLLLPENIDQLTEILKYHVVAASIPSTSIENSTVKTLLGESVDVQVSSTGIRVDNATVVEPYDVMASNGIIHAIDSVLVPANMDLPSFANATTDLDLAVTSSTTTASPVTTEMAVPTESIYELATSTEDFSTLAAAIDAVGLDEALSGDGSFTVFAPSNSAFAKLPKELLDFLLSPENADELGMILKYHVVAANVPSTSIQTGSVETLNGESVNVQVFSTGIRVDEANVVEPFDVAATNGVVHTIDSVLIPSNVDLPSFTSSPTDPPVTSSPTKKSPAPTPPAPTLPAPTPEESSIEDTENTATIKSSVVKLSLVLCFLGMFVA